MVANLQHGYCRRRPKGGYGLLSIRGVICSILAREQKQVIIRSRKNYVGSSKPLAKMSDWKKELQKLNLPNNAIPAHGHFCFTYNQCLMYESMSFQWHGVRHSDTIGTSGY
ncbi:hypothetical protein VNO77_20069 [Canavalia gladiata]|uniref:Uncharacterized protein n=1 Tax=Canavalia gladiata TaxID=3824 RepID=A0AAN9LNP1_CANGL